MRLETASDTMSHHSDEGSVVPGNYSLIIDQTVQKGMKIEKV